MITRPNPGVTEMCGPQTTTADSIQGTAIAQLQQNQRIN
jgi:hypothetical protein